MEQLQQEHHRILIRNQPPDITLGVLDPFQPGCLLLAHDVQFDGNAVLSQPAGHPFRHRHVPRVQHQRKRFPTVA
ncbi:hypothetical protein D3C81_2107700 [compost metagenome]